MTKILDTTIRDGGHQTNWEFDDNYVYSLIECCKNSKIDYMEIGYRNYADCNNKGKFFRCNPELCQKFFTAKSDLKIGIMADTSRLLLTDFTNSAFDYVDFVRLACHPDRISQTLEYATELYSRGYKIFIQLMEIPNVKDEHYKILAKWDNKNIIESLYIADSYSNVYPQDIKQYFNILYDIGYKNISFHAHNDINRALENTLAAIEAGAYCVDITHNGLGGNLDAVELLSALSMDTQYYDKLPCLINCR